ncbi:PREDICTED: glutathione S-transferase T3-like [Camelina sativa]|uniref:Glutathione S-transferase T3-like n=1 Tax=Camelina sativa TaxID=90675 RepID=A0ABM0T0L8_CAMSA|nr:PREDICTED: glutathione S-transferase T3-like [Camelina sativa]
MDSRNPLGFSPHNFQDLLNSQKVCNGYDNSLLPNTTQTSQPIQFSNPFSSQPVYFSSTFSSQPVHFSSAFSSQSVNFSTQSEYCIEVTVDENEEEGGRGSRRRWSAQEDVNLISAWLNTSRDPVVSNEQRIDSFWKRVADYYTANDGASGSNARGAMQCPRWNKINNQVNKFVGCYAQASTRRKSGESEDDVMTVAYEVYKNDMKKPFTLGMLEGIEA